MIPPANRFLSPVQLVTSTLAWRSDTCQASYMNSVLVAGNLALDFIGTLSERGHARVEQLREPADLARWVVAAGLTDAGPTVTEPELSDAIELREALYRLVAELIDGRPPGDADRELMNRWAVRTGPEVTVGRNGRRLHSGSTEQCLAGLAAAAVELWDRDDGAQIRWCADDQCTHPFLDRSRNQQRRWCDMATCGDRAKVRSYRARRSG